MEQSVTTCWDVLLNDLDGKGLRRSLRDVSGQQGREVMVDGRRVLSFCSNNYLGLAGDERLALAAAACLREEGFGSGASRLVSGNMAAHRELERNIASFKGAESCLVFNTGYMANVGIIASVFGRDDIIFSDRFNHASIIDGIQLSRARYKRYPHCDMNALEVMLKGAGHFRRRGIITDSVFSMDGDMAPLDEIVGLAKRYDAMVMIDEAHAFGVMGEKGRGLAEHFGVEKDIDIQMGTLSKAAGSFGAYVCGPRGLTDFLANKARSFIYTTGMPPSVAAASSTAVGIMATEPERRQRLWDNAHYVRRGLQGLGFDPMGSRTPIIPVLVKDSPKAVALSNRLFDKGILVAAIRPPTVPAGTARLRLTVMATHTREDLDRVLEQLQSIGRELCLI